MFDLVSVFKRLRSIQDIFSLINAKRILLPRHLHIGPFQCKESLLWFIYIISFTEILIFKANRVDQDQTPRSAASDLGLQGLLRSNF